MSVCSQRVYFLKLLRSQYIPREQLHMVCVTLILSRIVYALPAWGWHLTTAPHDWMLSLNGLETLVLAMQIIPWPNYLTRQMLGFYACTKTRTLSLSSFISRQSFYMDLRHRGVFSNVFSFRQLYISSNVLCVHAFPAMLAFVEHK